MALLSPSDIQAAMNKLNGWSFKDNAIHKTITFKTYMDGIAFVNQLAEVAETHNHHPDLTVGWCRVGVTFLSHDQGGVTDRCIAMARNVETIINN
ncbi:4a-hydroxytetrahydrobiopterin dehydratase [Caldithrix abyssi]|nr:4a-hydroxytetrahydrobiopterin dehydratase [Caldithrix abyssi]